MSSVIRLASGVSAGSSRHVLDTDEVPIQRAIHLTFPVLVFGGGAHGEAGGTEAIWTAPVGCPRFGGPIDATSLPVFVKVQLKHCSLVHYGGGRRGRWCVGRCHFAAREEESEEEIFKH